MTRRRTRRSRAASRGEVTSARGFARAEITLGGGQVLARDLDGAGVGAAVLREGDIVAPGLRRARRVALLRAGKADAVERIRLHEVVALAERGAILDDRVFVLTQRAQRRGVVEV